MKILFTGYSHRSDEFQTRFPTDFLQHSDFKFPESVKADRLPSAQKSADFLAATVGNVIKSTRNSIKKAAAGAVLMSALAGCGEKEIEPVAANQAPEITALTAVNGLKENIPTGTVVATFEAIDKDGQVEDATLTKGADKFVVDLTAGEIRTKAGFVPDFETNPTLELELEITDNQNLKSERKSVEINFLDVNEINQAPEITALTAVNGLKENIPGNTVVATFEAIDRDGEVETATLTKGADKFVVDLAAGEIRTKAGFVPDFETNPTLELELEITDNQNLKSERKSVEINFLDVDETPSELGFAELLVSLKGLLDRQLAGEDISQVIIGNSGKTVAEHQTEWQQYIRQGSYEGPDLYQIIVDGDRTGTLAQKHFPLARSEMLYVAGTDNVYSIRLVDRIGRYFRQAFRNKYNLTDQRIGEVFDQSRQQVHTPWATKAAQVLALIKDLAIPLTTQNATREKFREHLRKAGPYLSSALMNLPAAELDQILAEIKVLFDETEAKSGNSN